MGAGSARPLLYAMFDRIYNLTVPADTNKEKNSSQGYTSFLREPQSLALSFKLIKANQIIYENHNNTACSLYHTTVTRH